MVTSCENQLRLLIANRQVAWLAIKLPDPCIRAGKSCWRNDFFPDPAHPWWSRVVVLSSNDLSHAFKLVSPTGCVILVERVEENTALNDLPGKITGRIETDDQYVLTVIVAANAAAPLKNHETERRRYVWQRSTDRWASSMRRLSAGIRLHGPWRRRAIAKFLRDIADLDAEMAHFKDYYWAQFTDPPAPADPAMHYLIEGARLGLDPTPAFSTRQYLSTYRDVEQAKINPLLHYLRDGRREGRLAKPAALGLTPPPTTASPRLTELVRREPITDLWLGLRAQPVAMVNWAAIAATGPCSVILLSTSQAATQRWLKTVPEAALLDRLDPVFVTSDAVAGLSKRWRRCLVVDGADPLATGVSAAIHDRIIVCADIVNPIPDAFGILARQVSETTPLLVGNLLSRTGVRLAPLSGTGIEADDLVLDGGGLAPSLFLSDQRRPASAHLVAGTRTALSDAADAWRSGRVVHAPLAPAAIAFPDEPDRLVSTALLGVAQVPSCPPLDDNPGAILSVMIDDWIYATQSDGLALRGFLLDAMEVVGTVHLYCRSPFLPLSDLAWLGERKIEISQSSAFGSGLEYPARGFVAIGQFESEDPDTLSHDFPLKTVSLTQMRDIYAASHYPSDCDLDIIATDNSRILCPCPTPADAAAISAWIAEQRERRSEARVLVVGKVADQVEVEHDGTGAPWVTVLVDEDWLRFIDWMDAVALPVLNVAQSAPLGTRITTAANFHTALRESATQRVLSIFNNYGIM